MKLFLGTMLILSVASTRRLASAFVPPLLRQQAQQWSLHSTSSSAESDDKSSESSSTTTDKAWSDYKNTNNIDDQIVSAISADGGIKVTVATVRNLVNDAVMMHSLNPTPADAMGRLMTSALLMANGIQAEQTIQLTLSSNGPLRGCMAIATGQAELKGYVGSPQIADMPLPEAVGKGTLQCVKNHPNWTNPYNGITEIRHGDIDRDVGLYLAESEQKVCALAAATTMNGILCTSAGGYLVEQLPGVEAETIAQVEKNLARVAQQNGGQLLPTNLLLAGTAPAEICQLLLADLDGQPLQQMKPALACDCTEERLFRALRLLPREDVDDILEKQEQIEARCQFCGQIYRMGPEEVEKRFLAAKGDPSKDEDL